MKIKKYFKLESNGTDIPIFIQSVAFLIYTIVFKEISTIMLIIFLIMILFEIRYSKLKKQLEKQNVDNVLDLSKEILDEHKKLVTILEKELPDQYIDKINREMTTEEDGTIIKVKFN